MKYGIAPALLKHRETSLEALAKLKPVVRPDGTVMAGNASGVNDGACALLLANADALGRFGLTPRARVLGLRDDDPRVNPNGGAIALGHPLGMSGARLVTTATCQLQRTGGRYALCTMCIGVGQGIALAIERV
jgi:acetyl-CoA C-acetyltransferase